MNQIITLTVGQLLSNDEYIIPIYQRNYAWGDAEIEALITDIKKAMERDANKNYYIGTLVVSKREDGKFEVIDGQQRLTTLTLIASFLRNNGFSSDLPNSQNINFEYRKESEKALSQIFTVGDKRNDDLPSNFKEAITAVKKYLPITRREDFVNFLLNKVEIIRTELPEETDLNHYFEIMNTRGEQLEKHEVLKSRLMSKLSNSVDRNAFAKIWDACSDMNRYVVLGFKPELREKLFGNDWQSIPNDFEIIANNMVIGEKATNTNAETETKNEAIKPTIENIINGKFKGKEDAESETSERFNAVIDFANLLMHVLRIYLEKHRVENINPKDIPLDERNLLESFKFLDQVDKEQEIKNFALLLLQVRYLFDRFIIKTDTSKEKDDHWSLLTLKHADKGSYQYNNTFSDAEQNQNLIMLLSMFHVSNPSRLYKNWLYAVLRWLVNQENEGIEAKSYINFLEDLSDRFYFSYFDSEKDYYSLIQKNEFKLPQFESVSEMPEYIQNLLTEGGTSIPNFIFNRLDYLLWKNTEYKKIYPDFRFTFRSSVEHFYPQNPPESSLDEGINEVLHSIGNLCLISSSTNSKFTNNMPQAKKANFGKSQYNSLKLAIMMSQAENWNKDTIQDQEKAMIDILNKKLKFN